MQYALFENTIFHFSNIFKTFPTVEKLGGKCLPLELDVRNEDQVRDTVKRAVETFGSIDILINNASAISLTNTSATDMKKFDLMFGVNVRGTYLWLAMSQLFRTCFLLKCGFVQLN